MGRFFIYYCAIVFGILLCMTGIGCIFGIPLIILAHRVSMDFIKE